MIHLCLALGLGFCSCNNDPALKRGETDSIVLQTHHISEVDSIIRYSEACTDDLSKFKCVLDTLNSDGDLLEHSEYFLYDISGDSDPELWIKTGSCEADKKLWVYTAENSKVRKILSDYGGHTDFFINGNTIGSVTCNTGSGYVSIYRYDGNMINVKTAEFSMWNDEGEARAVKKKEQSVIEIWGNSDYDIYFNPLK